MNIAFINGGFSNIGGADRVVSIILNEISKREDYNVFSIEFLNLSHQYFAINKKVHRFSLYHSPLSMTKAIIIGKIIQKAKKIIKENHIEIVIGCGAIFFPVAVIASKMSGAKSICWEHTNPKVCNEFKFLKQIRQFGLKCSNANVLITESAKKYYDSIKKKNNVLIYNPVDKQLFMEHTPYNVKSKKIISVGRLCYAKNYDLLIQIAEKVLNMHTDWSWDIYGDGEEYDRLKKLISDTTISDRLTLKGNSSNIYELYSQYSFLVMTSRYEGFPMVLLEAAAKSLPLVSFDIETGPNEIIVDDVNGYLINANDSNSMITKIENLICNPKKRKDMSINAYETAKKFTLERICEQWYKLFENI